MTPLSEGLLAVSSADVASRMSWPWTVQEVAAMATSQRTRRYGRVADTVGLRLTIVGVQAAIGELIEVHRHVDDPTPLLAEVVASRDENLICLPLGDTSGLQAGQLARATGRPLHVPVGPSLLGRVVDGLGAPMDGLGPVHEPAVSVLNHAPNPLERQRIDTSLGLGVRALDTMVPIGRGQRVAIMAGSGVGKSSLLSMVARGSEADVTVIALIGERGREVREFIENDLGPEGLAKSVVVVATSDAPAVERLRAAFTATRIAEEFRDQGRHVVLMMDSVTRFAMAQREIGLSAGEPAATRGYPPSVFGLLPKLLERAGTGRVGSITGLYTVLIEGDDLQDPIGDTVRSILDGHIVLSRSLATANHFPAIDVLESISRLASTVTNAEQKAVAGRARELLAAHRDVKDMVEIGYYKAGTNPTADAALRLLPDLTDFLRQDMDDSTPPAIAWQRLAAVVGG